MYVAYYQERLLRRLDALLILHNFDIYQSEVTCPSVHCGV